MRRLIPLVVLASAVAVTAGAQERPARERERSFVYSFGPGDFKIDLRRGRLGVTVDLTRDAARDSIGARVAGVTPGGPADRAGVRTGDIITRLNGTRLATAAAGEDDDEDQSRPGLRLIRLASRLEGGDSVRLDVRRDGRNQTFTFVAEESDMDRIVERMRIPLRDMMPDFRIAPGEPGRMRVFAFSDAGLDDLELVKVSPALAEGLGISEGLLVVEVGADTTLGLRPGDVIVSIGSRRPTSPSHAMRILSTYEPGEAVQFEVMRQRRRTSVGGRLPEERARWRNRNQMFHQPLLEMFRHRLPDLRDRIRERIELRTEPGTHGLIRIQGEV
jgi:C-terminal processing protease CtpA/Prc